MEINVVGMPRVSVGIPVCNGEKYLRTAIDSVLEQDYEDFELLLSDNASTDGTAGICAEYAAADRRVRYFRNDVNIGAVPNFNRVFALGRGEFFKWLPCDDACYPSLLRRSLEVFDRAPRSVSLVYPWCEMIDERGDYHGRLDENVETRAGLPHQRLRKVLVKRSSAAALGGLIRSEHLMRTRLRGPYAMDDMGLLAELSMVGEFWMIREVLLKVRVHPENASRRFPTTRSHAAWLDPQNAGKYVVLNPQVRLMLECFRSILHLPMRPWDKLLCGIAGAAAYCERPLRDVAGKWKSRWCGGTSLPAGQGPQGPV